MYLPRAVENEKVMAISQLSDQPRGLVVRVSDYYL